MPTRILSTFGHPKLNASGLCRLPKARTIWSIGLLSDRKDGVFRLLSAHQLCHLIKQLLQVFVANLVGKRGNQSLALISAIAAERSYNTFLSTPKAPRSLPWEIRLTNLRSLKLCKLLVRAQQSFYGFNIFLLLEARKGVKIVERLVEHVSLVAVLAILSSFGHERVDDEGSFRERKRVDVFEFA